MSNPVSASSARIALVLGATGGVGGETAAALARHGWTVRALTRNPDAARAKRPDWNWMAGDALDREAVVAAAQGASVILHAVNPPGYRDWDRLVLPMIDNTIAAARASGARILLPGTIYNYGPDAFPLLHEDLPQSPTTRKGAIRVEMERRLSAACADDVRVLILRGGDYFGPRPGNSWFSQGLVTPGKPVRAIAYPGKKGVGHAWAYLPDVAETFAQLADIEAELEPFARYHFGGHWDADGTGMTEAVRRAVPGKPRVSLMSWPLLALIAPFNETLRELMEMKPLWRRSVQLDNHRLVARLGSEPHTPLDEAVQTSLKALGCL